MLNVRLRRRGRRVHNARGFIDILGHAQEMIGEINNCDDSIAVLSLGAT